MVFSQKAVEGMMRVRDKMNKGRVQDITQPCNTISSHLAKVSLNSTDPVLEINNRYRRLTPLEAARIQSFPDNFNFDSVSDIRKYKAIGNAVPPVMMWHIAKSLATSMCGCYREEREDIALQSELAGTCNPIQLYLFAPDAIYYSGESHVLIGTYKKGGLTEMKGKKEYTCPVTDNELQEHPQLLTAKHLLVQNKKSVMGYYNILNAKIVSQAASEAFSSTNNGLHNKPGAKYVLYELMESEDIPPIIETSDCTSDDGKGVIK